MLKTIRELHWIRILWNYSNIKLILGNYPDTKLNLQNYPNITLNLGCSNIKHKDKIYWAKWNIVEDQKRVIFYKKIKVKWSCWQTKRLKYYRCAHHGEGFSRPCLAVGKDAGIVALKGTFYYVRTKIVENLK